MQETIKAIHDFRDSTEFILPTLLMIPSDTMWFLDKQGYKTTEDVMNLVKDIQNDEVHMPCKKGKKKRK